ncbi:hypothetical protein F8G81_06380 [Arthrobacter sp. CDRTa11]|nr:hypothetical protein F8G81_06380 [Arthrobacter sp. CDRTa11]
MQKQPRDSSPGGESVSHSQAARTQGEILEYWTQQKMASARPRELRLPEKGPRLKQRGADAQTPGS